MGKKWRLPLILLFLALFLFSGWKVLSSLSENGQSKASFHALAQNFTATVPATTQTPVPTEPSSSPDIPETQPTEELVLQETAPITVDFEALREEYPDVVAWLYCPDTLISYPVVQSADNYYYLRRLPDGTRNYSGSIFLDYRCPADFSAYNSILYGHSMSNGTMFGALLEYREQEFFDSHPVFYLLTPTQDYKIELLGSYTTPSATEDTYEIPASPEGRDVLAEKARSLSTFQTQLELSPCDRLITLSTCAYEYDDARCVLVGVLRKLSPASP